MNGVYRTSEATAAAAQPLTLSTALQISRLRVNFVRATVVVVAAAKIQFRATRRNWNATK